MEDSLSTGLRARDLDGRITYVNPAFCAMVGFPAEALLGTAVPPYWPAERVQEYTQRQATRLAPRAADEPASSPTRAGREGFETLFVRRDGDRIPQWNHYKIAVAAHDIAKVRNYLQYKIEDKPQGESYAGPFQPSARSFGDGEAAGAEATAPSGEAASGSSGSSGSSSTEAMIQEYAPLVKTGLEQVLDPTQQQEVLRARIKNTQKMIKRSPPILRGPLQARLRVLKAKLKAAERRVELQREQESARRTWRTLGQVTVVGGVLLLLGLTARFVRQQRATG
jgi:two-component system sensor histidine kinase DctS